MYQFYNTTCNTNHSHSIALLLADYWLPVLAPDVVELGAVVVEGDVQGGDTPLLVSTVRLRAVHAVD